MKEIKNCPFCGGRATLRRKNRTIIRGEVKRNTYIYCAACDIRGARALYEAFPSQDDAEEFVIDMWNRRYNE